MEDDRTVAVDLLSARGQPLELDVARALDVAGLALVAFAHVDHARAIGQQLRRTLRRDLHLGILEGVHAGR